MIILQRKEDCCGCTACASICPARCITMETDEEGFTYPTTDQDKCLHCHLCEQVCPVLNEIKSLQKEIEVYAAASDSQDLLSNCSSGGTFSLLAEQIIYRQGIVYGAAYSHDYTEARHIRVNSIEDLSLLRGSKYLQSNMGNIFHECKKDLTKGTPVLFSGTPCQIKGLNLFLRKSYPNLLTVAIACHNVPSPKIWKSFLHELCRRKHIDGISRLSMTQTTCTEFLGQLVKTLCIYDTRGELAFLDSMYETVYGRCFQNQLLARPSCFECPAKDGRSGSDITLGDYWGIEEIYPDLSAQKGVSVIFINSSKGQKILNIICSQLACFRKGTHVSAVKYNSGLRSSEVNFQIKEKRNQLYKLVNQVNSERDIIRILRKFAPPRRGLWKIQIRKILAFVKLLKLVRKIRQHKFSNI